MKSVCVGAVACATKKEQMTSRERMLTAMRCQQPDRVPFYLRVFGFEPPEHLTWSNQVERVERLLLLGIDDILELGLGGSFHPEVQVRAWREDRPGERWPLLTKEYETPVGTLRQEVYRTPDWDWVWPHQGEEVRLLDDYNVPRSRRFLIETEADLEALPYLLSGPHERALATMREETAWLKQEADRLGVLLAAWGPSGVDVAVWLCGVENLIYMAMDKPEMFDRLLQIIHEQDKRLMEVALDSPAELVVKRGWYEHGDFWSPGLYRQHIQPRVQELTDMAHQAGKLMGYTISTGIMPLVGSLLEIGYDVHYHVDPVQGGADLRSLKATLGQQTALLGGMNSAVTLERGTDEQIRQAVYEAVEICAPGGGFILSPVDCLFPTTSWRSVEIALDAWREVAEY